MNASLSATTLTCKPGWTHWINTEIPDEEDPEDIEIIGETTAVKVTIKHGKTKFSINNVVTKWSTWGMVC